MITVSAITLSDNFCKWKGTMPVVPNHCSVEHLCSASWSQVFRGNLFLFYFIIVTDVFVELYDKTNFNWLWSWSVIFYKTNSKLDLLLRFYCSATFIWVCKVFSVPQEVLICPKCSARVLSSLKCSATQKRLGTTALTCRSCWCNLWLNLSLHDLT
jgi:hypothetical protein